MNEMFKPITQDRPNYIKVIGVGGGGNAVNPRSRLISVWGMSWRSC